jgi:hypothetical protein
MGKYRQKKQVSSRVQVDESADVKEAQGGRVRNNIWIGEPGQSFLVGVPDACFWTGMANPVP